MNGIDGIGTTRCALIQRRHQLRPACPLLDGVKINSLPTRSRSESGSASQADEVDLSAKRWAIVCGLACTDVRTERIVALRQSIGARRYHIPSSETAGKLISYLLRERT
jgi:anti-sigma28 factor (negative regulator of flagellin synthesis)